MFSSKRLAQGVSRNCFLSQGKVTNRFAGKRLLSSEKSKGKMSREEHDAAMVEANRAMKGYVQTRILAKQGKLRSKSKGPSSEIQSANRIQFSLFLSLAAAFIASPILGKKIAQDAEFREKYVPSWYDFRVKASESAWTRQELHEQIVSVEKDIRERAIRGDFTPEKLEELKMAAVQVRSSRSYSS